MTGGREKSATRDARRAIDRPPFPFQKSVMKPRVMKIPALLAPTLVLAMSAAAGAATMTVTVTSSPLGAGNYLYGLTFQNTAADDIPLATIGDAPFGDPGITLSLTAPADFVANYDGVLGVIDFAGDTDTFAAGGTYSGFSFESMAAPGTAFTSFSGFDNNGGAVDFTVNQVPEPTSLLIGASALLIGLSRRHRS